MADPNRAAYQWGQEWLNGSGPLDRYFGPGSMVIPFLQEHQHVNDIRSEVYAQINRYCDCESDKTVLLWPYSVGEVEGIFLYLEHYFVLVPDALQRIVGLDPGTDGPVIGAYLGSFTSKVFLLNFDCGTKRGDQYYARARYQVKNTSDVISVSHPPLFGYTK